MKKIIVSIYSEKAESQVKQYLDSEKIQYSSIDFDENLFIDEEDFDFDLEDLEDLKKEIEIPIKWK
jgi:CBS-domain-containing membrane protein